MISRSSVISGISHYLTSIGGRPGYRGNRITGWLGSLALAVAACGPADPASNVRPVQPDGGSKPDAAELAADNYTIHFIDVGQGAASLIINGLGQAILVDCGPRENSPRVLRVLEDNGVESLEAIILTHSHVDHYGGCAMVVSRHEVQTLFYSGYNDDSASYQSLVRSFEKTRRVADGDTADFGNLGFAFLHPPAQLLNVNSPENNNSVVMRICNETVCILNGGDLEQAGIASLLSRHGQADLNVVGMQVFHHGSRDGTTADLLRATGPGWAVIPVGEGNEYGHPHQETLGLLAAHDVRVFTTANDGTISAVVDESEISITAEH